MQTSLCEKEIIYIYVSPKDETCSSCVQFIRGYYLLWIYMKISTPGWNFMRNSKIWSRIFSSNSWYSTWNLFIDFCEFHSRTFPVVLRIAQKFVQHNSKAWRIYWKSLLIFSESLGSKNWKWNPIIFGFQKWNSKMHRILIKIFFLKSTHRNTY